MNGNSAPSKAPIRLWLRILLGVSLALNMLIIGLVVGAMLRFGGPDGMRPPPRSFGSVLYREMPRTERRALRTFVREAAKRGQIGRYDQHKVDIHALGSGLRAMPYDAEVVVSILQGQADGRAARNLSLQSAWLEQVAGMNDEARHSYADRLEHASTRPWFARRDRQGGN